MRQNDLWTPALYTFRGFVQENILNSAQALDIGCGNRKLPGAVGIDKLALSLVDVVHDLSVFPWPFADNSFDLVFANHFLEHADDVLRTMEEINRVLAPGGRVVIQVPYFRCVDAYTDPTHKHFFASQTLDYCIADTRISAYAYTPARFIKRGFWFGWPHSSRNPLKQLLKSFITSHASFYDQYLSLLFPVKCLTWELESIKKRI
ncbi:MAG: class I SAM-dependent methyltransferase [Minisyncoccia bacterium]